MTDPLTEDLVIEAVERSSKECVYVLGQVSMMITLFSILEIPRARFKEKNKVVADGLILSINSIHSHDEDNVQERGYEFKAY